MTKITEMLVQAKRFQIMIETDDGSIIEAFTWNGSPESGIAKAQEQAPAFGYIIQRVWAEPLHG